MFIRLGLFVLLNVALFSPEKSYSQFPEAKASVHPEIPKREVRATWIVTAKGTNWPKSFDPEEQKRTLVSIIQTLKAAHLNTLVLQVRARGDLIYPSRYEPWASPLTGVLGGTPTYDPLRFAIEEVHKAGLEIHAWWNVAKVGDGPERPPFAVPPHIVNAHPDWVRRWANRDRKGRTTSTEWWLDMGIPEVRAYLIDLAMEMVRTYDLDGIHFDFLRYPGPDFEDEKTYAHYGNNMARDEWRRENINKFVRAIYDSIMALKPMLKVGSTPIGIYKNLPGAEGWQAYVELYQDARRWLAEGKQDYIMPQLYWDLSGNTKFNILVRDWQGSSHGRHVYAGIGAYKPRVLSEIPLLIDSTRAAGALGNCFFTYDDILKDSVFADRYRYPALIPPMPWKDSIPPNPPLNLTAMEEDPGQYLLRWMPSPSAADGDSAKYFVVYRFLGEDIRMDDPSNLVAVLPGNQLMHEDLILKPTSPKYRYAVTALDKGNLESVPSNLATVMIAELVALSRPFEPTDLLAQSTPNPISQYGFIAYELRQKSEVELKVFDFEGKEVATLVRGVQDAGRHVVALTVEKFPRGRYTYSLSANGFTARKALELSR